MNRLLPALACVSAALSGCAVIGNTTLQEADSQQIRQLLQQSQAAQPRLQAMLGRPDDKIRFGDGRQLWVYRSDKYQPKWQNFTNVSLLFRAQSHQSKELVVLFDARGNARQWRLQDESREENTGLMPLPKLDGKG
ncbi:hypothetical protein [Chromobacterium amazonense]|uniref:Lipoprotein SmpA/OmlA domain-containing protein n=1 Tax=Chromobacterium amazonense TaxID=1382803 RepID=A0A1S1X8Y5_9NEIS|nr:hypothetical protein [Chromobacterium amazonense]KIA82225.1 hypothetical protein QR66_00575 [Chromobacterium piscinae]MDQ4539103.1 hypothetical protein [Chromobacterium amazonense]OHX15690.1 hypothetical protein BI343_17095 [Chromobacterium amazonense]PRP72337.1 hypothetical protein BUE93_02555 [Chromobacterium amazonense]